ncbi:transposase [Streptomyces sp. P17]|uniref:transposase n=1 Tax=Streptomyces sp. P17 TaxID=3074716 RepID=UPI0037DBF39D
MTRSVRQWQPHYATRASVESTIARGLRRCGLRRTRYTGPNQTRLQHVLTAAALNQPHPNRRLADGDTARQRLPLRPPEPRKDTAEFANRFSGVTWAVLRLVPTTS